MTTTIAMLTLDCAEVTPVADFWKAALGYENVAGDGESYAMLQPPDKAATGPAVGFGKVEGYQPAGLAERARQHAVPPRPGRRGPRRRDRAARGPGRHPGRSAAG